MDSTTKLRRRAVLHAGAATAMAAGAAAQTQSAAAPTAVSPAPALDPVPPMPRRPTPGQPGDFNFLAGEWHIDHWRRAASGDGWDRFGGEATCWTILGGVGSVEELRIPARNFSGMGLRLLDVDNKVWSDFWVNARSGVLTSPGQTGSFEQGVGVFWSEDEDKGRKVIWAGLWDQIAARSCRWRQVTSDDGGKTWTHHWVMHWRRA